MNDMSQTVQELVCPACGGTEFRDFRKRVNCQCVGCGSVERDRVARLFLDKYVKPQPGWKVLHCAPERSIYQHLKAICGDGYEATDFEPELYKVRQGLEIAQLDLCAGAPKLPTEHYDLVIHNHVMEHLPCNFTVVLQHLHRAIKPGGVHLFSVPMSGGYFREDMDPSLTKAERTERYVQFNHMRRFGQADIDKSLGAIFPEISAEYSLLNYFSAEDLLRAGVRKKLWVCTGSSVFFIRKPSPADALVQRAGD